MKKVISLVIVAAMMLFAGCVKTPVKTHDTVVFYYIHNEFEYGASSGVVTPAGVEVAKSSFTYNELLEQYFNGPTNYDCISPFPAGMTLEDLQVDSNKAQLLLSPHMATLSGSSLTIALACLTRTVIEMTDVEAVQIRIQNNQIYGMESLTLTLNSFAYSDDAESAGVD